MSGTPSAATSPMLSVYDGRTCAGFILNRGHSGFEAFDPDENSLGIFENQDKAGAALLKVRGRESTPSTAPCKNTGDENGI